MKAELTKQDILDLLERQTEEFHQRLLESDKSMEKSRKEFHQRLLESDKSMEKSRKEFQQRLLESEKSIEKNRDEFHRRLLESEKYQEKSRKEFDINLQQSRVEFDRRLGELGGTWGKFVAELVRPGIIELFRRRGIRIETSLQNVAGFIGDEPFYEIDLLLINSDIAVAVEIKSTLGTDDVKEHLERLEKIQKVQPKRVNLSGVTLYGAVAGMIVENNADRYAYRKGLFVLRQKGNIIEIVNDEKFVPKEWIVTG